MLSKEVSLYIHFLVVLTVASFEEHLRTMKWKIEFLFVYIYTYGHVSDSLAKMLILAFLFRNSLRVPERS